MTFLERMNKKTILYFYHPLWRVRGTETSVCLDSHLELETVNNTSVEKLGGETVDRTPNLIQYLHSIQQVPTVYNLRIYKDRIVRFTYLCT